MVSAAYMNKILKEELSDELNFFLLNEHHNLMKSH